MKDKDASRKLDFLLSKATEKLGHQLDIWNSLEQKTGLVLGFLATIIEIGAVVFGWHFGYNFLTAGIGILLVSLILATMSLWPRSFCSPINLNKFYSKKFLARDYLDIKNQALADTKKCCEMNVPKLKRKSQLFRLSLLTLVMGMAVSIFGIGVVSKNSGKGVEKMDNSNESQNQNQDQDQDHGQDYIEPVEPGDSPGDSIQKDDKPTIEPVEPSEPPGNSIPFGETMEK